MEKKHHRVIALLLSICILLTMMPTAKVWATDATGSVENVIINSSFETVENNAPAGWTIAGSNDEDTVSIVENSKVLMLNKNNTAPGNPAEMQTVEGLSGSVLTEDGTAIATAVTYTITARVMIMSDSSKPVIDMRGNSKASGKDTAGTAYRKAISTIVSDFELTPGTWQNITYEYIAPSDLTSIQLRLVEQGGLTYWDDVILHRSDDTEKTNLLANGNFETSLTGWSFFSTNTEYVKGTHYDAVDLVADKNNAIQLSGNTDTSDISVLQTLSVTAGCSINISAYVKLHTGSATPYLKVTYYDADGNAVGDSDSVDCGSVQTEFWTTIEAALTVPANSVTATICVGQIGEGTTWWDLVQMQVPISELINGSFETNENGMPSDWSEAGCENGDLIFIESASKVLMLNKTPENSSATGNPAMYQTVSDLSGSTLTEDGTALSEEVKYTVSARVMVMTGTSKPVFDIRGNAKTSGTDAFDNNYRKAISTIVDDYDLLPGTWTEVTYEYTAPVGLSSIQLRVIEQGDLSYWDDIALYRSDDETKTNLLVNGAMENALTGWTFVYASNSSYVKGTHYDVVDTTSDGLHSVNFLGTSEDSAVSLSQTMNVTGGAEYTYSASVQALGETGTPVMSITHYNAAGETVGDTITPSLTDASLGVWLTVTDTYTTPTDAAYVVIRVGENGIGLFRWDDIQYVKGTAVDDDPDPEPETPAEIAQQFRDMLAEEKITATDEIGQIPGATNSYDQAYGDTGNIVLNGDFELYSGTNTLEYWNLEEKFSAFATVVPDGGDDGEGDACIMFTIPEADGLQNPYYDQWVKVEGGAEYQITYKYKLVGACAKPTVKIECWTDTSLPGASYIEGIYAHMENNQIQADGQWHTYTQKVYPSDNVQEIQVLARSLARAINTDGTVLYLDDVEIIMTQPPVPMTLETDSIFYYTDIATATGAEGIIATTINTGYFPEYASGVVDLEIKDDGVVIWSSIGNVSVEGAVTASFPLSLLAEKDHRYEVVATLYNTDGTTIKQREVQNVYVLDRPGCLGADGVYHPYDGTAVTTETFYPEYAYHVVASKCDDYQKIKESGINLVQMGTFTDVATAIDRLDKAQAAGIMGFICLYNDMLPAGHDNNIDNTVAIIEAVKDHPALFGYGIMDEVFLNLANPEADMEASYRLIRALDPNHPIMTMEAVRNYYKASGKYVDILCIDPYASAASQKVSDAVTLAVNAVNGEKPVYALLEAYRNTSGNYPTANDVRNNIWQALISGASCVGYFSITDSEIGESGAWDTAIWDANDGGALWNAICQFGDLEKQIAYDRFVFNKQSVYSEFCGDDYWYSSWKVGNSLYMVVLSMLEDADEQQTIAISLANDANTESVQYFTAVPISGSDETITGKDALNVTIAGCEAVLYKIDVREPSFEVNIEHYGQNLRLQDLIKIGYYFTVETDAEVEEVGALLWNTEQYATESDFTVTSASAKKYTNLEVTSGLYTIETEGIYVQNLDDVYYMIPYVKTADGYTYGEAEAFSALEYIEGVYAKSDAAWADTRSLVIDLANYGAAARNYFSIVAGMENPDVPFNSCLSAEDRLVEWSDSFRAEYPDVDETGVCEVEFFGRNVNLLEAISMGIYYQNASNISGAYYWSEEDYNESPSHNEENATGVTVNEYLDGGFVKVKVTGLYAYNIYDNYYVRPYDASGNLGDTIGSSVAAYLTQAIDSYSSSTDAESVAVVELCKAMLVYGENAKDNPAINKG